MLVSNVLLILTGVGRPLSGWRQVRWYVAIWPNATPRLGPDTQLTQVYLTSQFITIACTIQISLHNSLQFIGSLVDIYDFSDWPLTEPQLHRDASASKKSFLCIGKCAESCHTSITSLGPRQRCDSQSWRGQFDNLPSHNCMNRWLIYRAIKCPVYIIIYQLVVITVEWLTAGLAELKMSNVFISLCILQPLESPVKTFVKIKCYETLP